MNSLQNYTNFLPKTAKVCTLKPPSSWWMLPLLAHHGLPVFKMIPPRLCLGGFFPAKKLERSCGPLFSEAKQKDEGVNWLNSSCRLCSDDVVFHQLSWEFPRGLLELKDPRERLKKKDTNEYHHLNARLAKIPGSGNLTSFLHNTNLNVTPQLKLTHTRNLPLQNAPFKGPCLFGVRIRFHSQMSS